jgi:hypothetical protein
MEPALIEPDVTMSDALEQLKDLSRNLPTRFFPTRTSNDRDGLAPGGRIGSLVAAMR